MSCQKVSCRLYIASKSALDALCSVKKCILDSLSVLSEVFVGEIARNSAAGTAGTVISSQSQRSSFQPVSGGSDNQGNDLQQKKLGFRMTHLNSSLQTSTQKRNSHLVLDTVINVRN